MSTPPPDWVAKLLSILDALSGLILLALALAGWIIIYVPIRVGGVDLLAEIQREWGGWILAASIVFSLLTLAKLAQWMQRVIARAWQRRAERRAREKREKEVLAHLDTLSRDEHRVLAQCVSKNERTRITSPMEPGPFGTIGALDSKGLMTFQGTKIMATMSGYPYTIPGFVWDELQKRRESFLLVTKSSNGR